MIVTQYFNITNLTSCIFSLFTPLDHLMVTSITRKQMKDIVDTTLPFIVTLQYDFIMHGECGTRWYSLAISLYLELLRFLT